MNILYMSINGVNRTLGTNVKAKINGCRVYIPFRALSEATGVDVEWDSESKTAIYTTDA